MVSSNKITPLIKFERSLVLKSNSLYCLLDSKVESTLIESKRFFIVLVLSSAARIPFGGEQSFFAMFSLF